MLLGVKWEEKMSFMKLRVERPRLMNLKGDNAQKQRGGKDRRGNPHGISSTQRPKPALTFGSFQPSRPLLLKVLCVFPQPRGFDLVKSGEVGKDPRLVALCCRGMAEALLKTWKAVRSHF